MQIVIVGLQGNQTRVGINTPAHVAVHREEIYERNERPLIARGHASLSGASPVRAATGAYERRAQTMKLQAIQGDESNTKSITNSLFFILK